MKRNTIISAIGILLLVSSCGEEDFKTTESGLQYKFHTKQKDVRPNEGDIAHVHLAYYDENDSLLFNSKDMRDTFLLSIEKPSFKGAIEEGLLMMGEGDSITMLVSADSVYEKTMNQPRPDFVREGSNLKFNVKMIGWRTQDQYNSDMQAKEQRLQMGEQNQLQDYIASNFPALQPTESGMYFVELEKGSGALAKEGDEVKVDYVGTFIDGTVFDSSTDREQKAEFTLGQGMVIPAWDEALQKMNKGAKAKIIVPSSLAYGARGYPGLIPPFKTLVFEMTLLEIR